MIIALAKGIVNVSSAEQFSESLSKRISEPGFTTQRYNNESSVREWWGIVVIECLNTDPGKPLEPEILW